MTFSVTSLYSLKIIHWIRKEYVPKALRCVSFQPTCRKVGAVELPVADYLRTLPFLPTHTSFRNEAKIEIPALYDELEFAININNVIYCTMYCWKSMLHDKVNMWSKNKIYLWSDFSIWYKVWKVLYRQWRSRFLIILEERGGKLISQGGRILMIMIKKGLNLPDRLIFSDE